MAISCPEILDIPLEQKGTKIRFNSRVPTDEELDEIPESRRVHLTSPHPWNPSTVELSEVLTGYDDDILHESTSEINKINRTRKLAEMSHDGDQVLLGSISSQIYDIKDRLIGKIHVNSKRRKIQEFSMTGDSNVVDVPARKTLVSTERHAKVTAEEIAELWCIGPKRAQATLEATTQRGTRSAILPISRRFRADRMYRLKRLNCSMATDTMYSDVKSLMQNIGGQIYSHKCDFAAFYPVKNSLGGTLGDTLLDFVHEYGAPEKLTFDGAMSQVGSNTNFQSLLRKMDIPFHISSPRRPNENPAESKIREVKKRWYRIMTKKHVPPRLWDFCFIWICETSNLSVSSFKYAKGRTPLEMITGETPDISEYLEFGFYDWVVYKQNAGLGESLLGRWLGVSHKVGQMMSYWILPISGIPISCVTVQRLTLLEQNTQEWQNKMTTYNQRIADRMELKIPLFHNFTTYLSLIGAYPLLQILSF